MLRAYPTLYYTEQEDKGLSDEIILPLQYYHTLLDEFQDEPVLYVLLTNTQNAETYLATIGHSHDSNDSNLLYVPQWILDTIHYTEPYPTTLRLEKAIDNIPVATKIIIKPLDPLAFRMDLRACFETAFTNLHSIREHITIPIILHDTDVSDASDTHPMQIFTYIEKVEPSSLSQIIYGEVDVEFLDDFADFTEDFIDDPPIEELTPQQRRQLMRDSWASKQ